MTKTRMKRLPDTSTTDAMMTDSYDYRLPPELIATEPAHPKDSARLLVVDRKTGEVTHTVVKELLSFIPKHCAILYNDTKVIKARLFGRKETGGRVELLINRPLEGDRCNVLIRGKVKPGDRLTFDDDLRAEVIALCEDGSRVVRFMDSRNGPLTFEKLLHHLDRLGHVPLPPYIQREERTEDAENYQPVFARQEGAVAAPTASLHFTEALFNKMRKSFDIYPITLHVGAGTFKPVEVKTITEHPMHSEYYEIPEETRRVIESGREMLAIGTTVARTVEYYVRTHKSAGECDLFLHPGNPPKRVDHLLTNFHLPKSTLIMLVASFLGLEKTLEVYRLAIEMRYRFYSYGDAMLIL